MPCGCDGAVVSMHAPVATTASLGGEEMFPASSTAVTVTSYDDPHERPVFVNVGTGVRSASRGRRLFQSTSYRDDADVVRPFEPPERDGRLRDTRDDEVVREHGWCRVLARRGGAGRGYADREDDERRNRDRDASTVRQGASGEEAAIHCPVGSGRGIGDPIPRTGAGRDPANQPSRRDTCPMTAGRDSTDVHRDAGSGDPIVDAVVVSYNSRDHLRASVGALTGLDRVRTIVVDNDSVDGAADSISDLPVTIIRRSDNGGFARACNEGMAAGSAPFVLFVNPDAVVSDEALKTLLRTLEQQPELGAAAPRIEHPDGSLAHSLRRFPDLLSTYAQAVYLHRLFPRAAWATEIVTNDRRYD